MLFQRETGRLLVALAIAFAVMAAAAAYWAVNGADGILRRPDNPRLFELEAVARRGAIVDRHERPLAYSEPINEGIGAAMRRNYPEPAAHSALGYFSLRYGTSGVEATYDTELRGSNALNDLNDLFESELLHRARVGDDVMVTLDLDIQQQLAAHFADLRGAAIVIDAPSGDVLALISQPTYDPNTLDADWDQLVETPGDPFFNRAVQGRYQPGGAMQTPLIAAALLSGIGLSETSAGGAAPLMLGALTLPCAGAPPSAQVNGDNAPLAITLSDAYRFACPAAFAALTERLDAGTIDTIVAAFQLNTVPTLPGYATGQAPTAIPTNDGVTIDDGDGRDLRLENALGQGTLVVSPLMMARIAAGIANDGDAPEAHLLRAIRAANAAPDAWSHAATTIATQPIATLSVARQLQALMRGAVVNGAAAAADQPSLEIAGHASLAYTGDDALVWFIGFVSVDAEHRIAIALVIENSDDIGLAARIGGEVLGAAAAFTP